MLSKSTNLNLLKFERSLKELKVFLGDLPHNTQTKLYDLSGKYLYDIKQTIESNIPNTTINVNGRKKTGKKSKKANKNASKKPNKNASKKPMTGGSMKLFEKNPDDPISILLLLLFFVLFLIKIMDPNNDVWVRHRKRMRSLKARQEEPDNYGEDPFGNFPGTGPQEGYLSLEASSLQRGHR